MPNRWTEVAEEIFSFSGEMHKNKCRTVYDLVCGVGRHSVFLAQRGFTVTASDLSNSAIENTRENLRQTNVEPSLHQIDMSAWPFDDGQFDAVIAFNVVYHACRSEIETILAQINRVLRPQGLLFITFKSVIDPQLPLNGPNHWPQALPYLQPVMQRYFASLEILSDHLLKLFASALDLPTGYLLDFFKHPNSRLKLNHYPPSTTRLVITTSVSCRIQIPVVSQFCGRTTTADSRYRINRVTGSRHHRWPAALWSISAISCSTGRMAFFPGHRIA
jgi:SAM-dependent methyltransferase